MCLSVHFTIKIMCFQQMHTICHIKYLQFLPTCFGPKDHHQGSVYNEHRDIVTDYTYKLLYGVWLY
jgi:hypothetical protein